MDKLRTKLEELLKACKVEVKKYDHEKGMPETPVSRPKAFVKPMGANEKPVRASRHRSQLEVARNTSGYEKMREDVGEHKVHEPETKKGETCSVSKNGQWSLDKNNRNRGKQGEQQRGHEFSKLMENHRHADEMDRQHKANIIAL